MRYLLLLILVFDVELGKCLSDTVRRGRTGRQLTRPDLSSHS